MIATWTISRTHSPSRALAQSSSCSLSPDSPETAKTGYYRYIQYKTELLDLADRTMARSARQEPQAASLPYIRDSYKDNRVHQDSCQDWMEAGLAESMGRLRR